MKSESEIKTLILELHSKLNRLPNRDSETEKKAEEYLSQLFGALGWDWLSAEVMPQKRVRSGGKTRRVAGSSLIFTLKSRSFQRTFTTQNTPSRRWNTAKTAASGGWC